MKQRKVIRLVQVRNERRAGEAEHIRRAMFACARNSANRYGDGLSGFALVTWNRVGLMRTAVNAGYGPVDESLLPEQCRDALQRHVMLDMQTVGDVEPEPEGA